MAIFFAGPCHAVSGTEVRFNRDIRAILSNNCLSCHGPDAEQRKGGLRLDVRAAALQPGESGVAAIVPGFPEKSGVIARIESREKDEVMPPPRSHKQLTISQIKILREWISGGAVYEDHWALKPIARPPLPTVRDKTWPRNAIDHFILARLEEEDIRPAPSAPAGMLLRRASFGLTGLPPNAAQLARFSAAPDDAHFSAQISEWLASEQYGEHWARHWMDVARYADSAGYELDYLFTHAWRYRDWLVRSFTEGKALDLFIQEQIAGSQLALDEQSGRDGELFLTIGPMRFEGGIARQRERENEWLTDLADTTGAAFLGMSLGCSRCHDHKFDPFTQGDYFGLQAIFAEGMPKQERVGKGGGNGDTRPASISVVRREAPLEVSILRRGEVDLPVRPAIAALPEALPGGGPLKDGCDKRLALARWLTSAQNPLTARVLVNRVWQWHFGQGLVRTPNDFGRQGDAPSHPELLDWLASELISGGWDLRQLQRLILDSAAYRQSSIVPAATRARDPENRLLAGFPRQRLQAEQLRDAMLCVSGMLNPKSYGPPVVPPVEKSALAALRNKNWEPSQDASEWNRRSVYMVVRRSIKLPFLEAFNGADTISSCGARDRTVVASQALAMLNSEESLACARALAGRLYRESQGRHEAAAAMAWQLLYARPVAAEEMNHAVQFLKTREAVKAGNSSHTGSAPPDAANETLPVAEVGEAWIAWCLALLNSNEFVYVD